MATAGPETAPNAKGPYPGLPLPKTSQPQEAPTGRCSTDGQGPGQLGCGVGGSQSGLHHINGSPSQRCTVQTDLFGMPERSIAPSVLSIGLDPGGVGCKRGQAPFAARFGPIQHPFAGAVLLAFAFLNFKTPPDSILAVQSIQL